MKHNAVTASTIGYLIEIGAAQFRHFPPRTIHPRIGTLSRQAMGFPHFGHFEPGDTIDSPSGKRAMQTLRKLPIIRPKTPRIGRRIAFIWPGASAAEA